MEISVHTLPEELGNACAMTGQFGFVFEENSTGKSRDFRDVIREKLVSDWCGPAVALSVDIKLRFEIPLA